MINETWWSLPGPAEYIRSVVQAIKDGNHVVLALPSHLPAGMAAHIRSWLGNDWPWYSLPADPGHSPLDLLFDRYISDSPAGGVRTPEALVRHPRLQYRVFSIELTASALWHKWLPFLTEYRRACHSHGRRGPAQFMVSLQGEPALLAPAEESLLRVKRWSNVTGQLEASLYAALSIKDRSLNPLKRQMIVATCAELALWDPSVIDRFVETGMEALDLPMQVLKEIGDERGWEPTLSPRWESGQTDVFDGEMLAHSALHAIRGETHELKRRIWKAQISVIFPFLEQRRRDIIEKVNGRLYAPFETTRNGRVRYVDSIDELEFTDIIEQLRTYYAHDSPVLRMIRELRAIRNDLAHMKSIRQDRLDFPFVSTLRNLDA